MENGTRRPFKCREDTLGYILVGMAMRPGLAGSGLGAPLLLRGLLAKSGDILGCHHWAGGTQGIPTAKSYVTPDSKHASAEMPSSAP
ncbi:hypothetical protein H8959_008029 [Pygathrix nigripes]